MSRRGHYVLIQEPRKDAVYVSCRSVDQCLTVVDEEIHNTAKGTRVTMLRSTGGDILEPLALWKVERRGKARRYRVNKSEELTYGDQRKVKGMHAFWRSRVDLGDVKLGFVVPPHFSTWSELEEEKAKVTTERLFERVRKEDFPERPSRKGAVFVCSDMTGFCKAETKYDRKWHRFFEVVVTGTVFYTDAVLFSFGHHAMEDCLHFRHTGDSAREDNERAEEYAQEYWRGEPTWMEESRLPELVVQGEVVVVGMVKP